MITSLKSPARLSKFEFNLVRILRFFIGQEPTQIGLSWLTAETPEDKLSPVATSLVEETLSKALVLFLTKNGGWRKDSYLSENKPVNGRVWDRIPLGDRTLTFSKSVIDFLVWATTENVNTAKVNLDVEPRTPADELFFFLAYHSVITDVDMVNVFSKKKIVTNNPFCWLTLPSHMPEEGKVPDLSVLFKGQRAVFLECLQTYLYHHWVKCERQKNQITDWKLMRHIGSSQYSMFKAFLEGAKASKRYDLTKFLLKTNSTIFSSELALSFWTGGLQGSGPSRLADRLEIQRAALALPRQMEVLERWQQHATTVGFFDEDYLSTQLWKSEWEAANGDRTVARAKTVIEKLEPLKATN